MLDEFPYEQALNDLEIFLNRVVMDQNIKNEFKLIIADARQRKTVPIRGIHEKLMQYRKEYKEYILFTDDEKEMIDNLLHFWG